MISDVPPSIELARERRNILRAEPSGASSAGFVGRRERVVVVDDAVGAEQVDAPLVGRLVQVRERELGDRTFRAGVAGAGLGGAACWFM